MGRGLFRTVSGSLFLLGATAFLFGAPAPTVTPRAPLVTSSRPPKVEPATVELFRIETTQGVIWSSDHPLQSGEQVTFHQHPDRALVSMRRSEIKRVSAERVLAHANGVVDIGVTGGGARRDAVSGGVKAAGKTAPGPGARPDGTALFNPDRKYQPDIDSKQVPGMNMAYPASANDYREGRTLAFPAPQAVQASPGDPPRMPDAPPPKPN